MTSNGEPGWRQAVFSQLARETGRLLGELGVRPEDSHWIEEHGRTIASLGRPSRGSGRGGLAKWLREAIKRRA